MFFNWKMGSFWLLLSPAIPPISQRLKQKLTVRAIDCFSSLQHTIFYLILSPVFVIYFRHFFIFHSYPENAKSFTSSPGGGELCDADEILQWVPGDAGFPGGAVCSCTACRGSWAGDLWEQCGDTRILCNMLLTSTGAQCVFMSLHLHLSSVKSNQELFSVLFCVCPPPPICSTVVNRHCHTGIDLHLCMWVCVFNRLS